MPKRQCAREVGDWQIIHLASGDEEVGSLESIW